MNKLSDTELIELRDFIYAQLTESQFRDILIRLDLYSLDDFDKEYGDYSGLSKRELIEVVLRELRDWNVVDQLTDELPGWDPEPNDSEDLEKEAAPLAEMEADEPREADEGPSGRSDVEPNPRSTNRTKIIVAIIGAVAIVAVPFIVFGLPRLFPAEVSVTPEADVQVEPTQVSSPTPSADPEQPESVSAFSSGMSPGCLSGDNWNLFGPIVLESEEGCLPVPGAWGLSAIDDGVSIFRQSADAALEAAIYRELPGDADIRFRFSVQEMTTVGNLVAHVAFGVSSTNPPQAPEQAFFWQKEGPEFPILLKLEQYGADFRKGGERVELTAGAIKQIELVVAGNRLTLFVDGEQVAGPLEISPRDRALWISWKIPRSASLQFEIDELELQEH